MKKFLLFLPILLAAGFWFWNPSSAPRVSEKLLPGFQPEAVSKITISSDRIQTTLTRSGEAWVVQERDNFPANTRAIASLLLQAWDLTSVQTITVEPSQLARLQLVAPSPTSPLQDSGTRVDFESSDGDTLGGFFLGKPVVNAGTPEVPGETTGRYIRLTTSQNQAHLTRQTFSEVVPAPAGWLDPRLPKMTNPITITYVSGNTTWQIALEDKAWKLVPERQKAASKNSRPKTAETLNLETLVPFLSQWQEPRFLDVFASSTDLTIERTLTIADEDGGALTYEIGKSRGATYPVTVKREAPTEVNNPWNNRTFLVPATLVDTIPHERSSLLAPSPMEKAKR